MSLTVMQNLLLNNLMYMRESDGPFGNLADFTGRRIGDYISALDLSGWEDPDPEHPPMTTAQEWRDIVKAIRSDPFLMNMKIVTVYTDLTPRGGACRSAVFYSASTRDAAVVFEGTEIVAGSAQWRDNFYSANLADSLHQLQALKWYKKVYNKYHLNRREVTLTGHSKGGNKAKYIMILDGRADHCESFNGEGFSDKFFDKYAALIAKRRHKIHNHIVNYDYVSLLLNDIGEETYYFGANYGSGGFTENHLSNTFMRFDEEGNIHLDIDLNGRPPEMKAFDEFCNSYLRSMDDQSRTASLKTMYAVLNAILSVDRTMNADEVAHVFIELAREESQRTAIAYFTAYVIRYEQANPEVKVLLNNVFEKFDLKGIVQYIDMADQILNWQKKVLFVNLTFQTLMWITAAVVKTIPRWVFKRVEEDIAKKGVHLSTEQLQQLQMILIRIEADLRKIVLTEEKTDRLIPEPETEEVREKQADANNL